MDPQFAKPLTVAVKKAFESLIQMDISFDDPLIVESMPEDYDISAIIGLSGGIIGLFVLSFPTETAEKVVSAFAGSSISVNDREDLIDAVGELANIIMRSGRTKLDCNDIAISSPSVVTGKQHCINTPSDNTIIRIPCHSSAGDFSVELSIRSVHLRTTSTRSPAVAVGSER